MSHKKHIITICIILLALTTLGIFWYTQKNTNKPVQTEIQEDVQEKKEKINNEIVYNNDEKIDTSDWQTYRNEEYGFEFKYPKECKIYEGNNVSIEKTVTLDCHKKEQFDKGSVPNNIHYFGIVYIYFQDNLSHSQYLNNKKEECMRDFGMNKEQINNMFKEMMIGDNTVVEGGCDGISNINTITIFNAKNPQRSLTIVGNIVDKFTVANGQIIDISNEKNNVMFTFYNTVLFN